MTRKSNAVAVRVIVIGIRVIVPSPYPGQVKEMSLVQGISRFPYTPENATALVCIIDNIAITSTTRIKIDVVDIINTTEIRRQRITINGFSIKPTDSCITTTDISNKHAKIKIITTDISTMTRSLQHLEQPPLRMSQSDQKIHN
ncbi:hypothetical protein DPMN_156122 [Dreissena polymorpha]|uniref:Uncharacterized protein n=1 Tax=Dreissena polymorpha TaxID=45954 RepID=A0A9D4J8I0_DREPO|nr:hypothetical protein DPMN_156122 [Dreissena polymorpha]